MGYQRLVQFEKGVYEDGLVINQQCVDVAFSHRSASHCLAAWYIYSPWHVFASQDAYFATRTFYHQMHIKQRRNCDSCNIIMHKALLICCVELPSVGWL